MSFLRRVSQLARLVFATAIAASTLPAAAETPTRVRLGTVAVEKNLFKKYGVKVELQDFPDPALMPFAIKSGGLQGAMYTYDLVINSAARDQGLEVVMPIDYSNGADALVADKSIRTVADLKGRKVAYPFSTCDNLLVAYALEKAGLEESDIQGIDTTPENVAAALTAGAVAGATYEPNITQILKLGGGGKYHVLFDSSKAPGLITDVLFFDAAYIAKNPKVIDAVMRGYLDGLAYLKAKPDEARKIVAKAMGVTAAEVKEQQKGVHNIPPAEMSGYFVKRDDSKSLYHVGAGIGAILVKRGQISSTPAIESTFDLRFVAALAGVK